MQRTAQAEPGNRRAIQAATATTPAGNVLIPAGSLPSREAVTAKSPGHQAQPSRLVRIEALAGSTAW